MCVCVCMCVIPLIPPHRPHRPPRPSPAVDDRRRARRAARVGEEDASRRRLVVDRTHCAGDRETVRRSQAVALAQ